MDPEEEIFHDRQNKAVCLSHCFCVQCECSDNSVECYLVVVCFAVGQALAFVVTVSKEGFLTLSTHKMLQTNQWPCTHG